MIQRTVPSGHENSFYTLRLKQLVEQYRAVVERPNEVDPRWNNGWYERFKHPVLTRDHIPLTWTYDLNPETNPRLLERMGVNSVFNAGAFEHEGKILLISRTEGYDRKSFFAFAESENGVDHFRFQPYPLDIPDTDPPTTNMYDMRLVHHEDGWIYGTFCAERKDSEAPESDTSAANAQCGIVRCDTQMHVARTNVETLLDYIKNTPEDGRTSSACVRQRIDLVRRNEAFIEEHTDCDLLKQTR